MNLKWHGIVIKKSINHTRLLKIFLSLLVSNLFFYLLFASSGPESREEIKKVEGVEIELTAEVFTPLIIGKRVLVMSSDKNTFFKAEVMDSISEQEKVRLIINEVDLIKLKRNLNWLIYPYSPVLSVHQKKSLRKNYEIYY